MVTRTSCSPTRPASPKDCGFSAPLVVGPVWPGNSGAMIPARVHDHFLQCQSRTPAFCIIGCRSAGIGSFQVLAITASCLSRRYSQTHSTNWRHQSQPQSDSARSQSEAAGSVRKMTLETRGRLQRGLTRHRSGSPIEGPGLLQRLVLSGERSLRTAIREFVEHYDLGT